MTPLDELVGLRDLDVEQAMAYLGTDDKPVPITGHGALRDVDALTSKERGVQFVFDRDGVLRLVYLGARAVPPQVDHAALVAELGTGEVLRSRQGRRAELHVVAPAGIAWSEEEGELGFLELFPPTTFDRYRDEIYEEPPAFRQ